MPNDRLGPQHFAASSMGGALGDTETTLKARQQAVQAAYDAHRRAEWRRGFFGILRWVLITVWVLCLMAVFLGGLKQIAADGITIRLNFKPPTLQGAPVEKETRA